MARQRKVLMKKETVMQMLDLIWTLFLILFGLLAIYQTLVKIFGGSWVSESLIIAFMVLSIGLLFKIAVTQAKMRVELNHFIEQFKSLAHDFKEHIKQK